MEKAFMAGEDAGATGIAAGNRLSAENSLYLEQHAHNPVAWFPWGEEAFELARREDRPIFLSIGYATCHWCHVMERESFEDEEVAALLNDSFVPVKVDREERPDIDHVYMTASQLMTGSGGWPLTIVMTPEGEPFFAATYVPRETRYGRPGLVDLLPRLTEAWEGRRQLVVESAKDIVSLMGAATRTVSSRQPGEVALEEAYAELERSYDRVHGGFGRGMKFPTPHQLVFLLRHARRTGVGNALEMATRTLVAMRRGGIYDQVGFGFHRYSTDPAWLVPHFEKMLYDQALLVLAYAEAFEVTREPLFARTVREIAAYVERDLTSPEGAFYSAEDADSQGEEGMFYLWTLDELDEALGEEDGALAAEVFGATAEGNFVDEASGRRTGRNILHLGPLATVVPDAAGGVSDARLKRIRAALLAARSRRVRPARDDKVLTDWNGLMIAALARASSALEEPALASTAARAADFLLGMMSTPDGGLVHRFRAGSAGIPAMLADYAFLAFGLHELHEATREPRHLDEALRLTREMARRFGDPAGGFFLAGRGGEELIVRAKELYDGAIPSGNSVAYLNLVRLGRLTGDAELEELAAGTARAFARDLARGASAHTFFLLGLELALGSGGGADAMGRHGTTTSNPADARRGFTGEAQ